MKEIKDKEIKDKEVKKENNINEESNEEKYGKVNINKKMIVISLIIVTVIGTTILLWFKSYDIINFLFDNVINGDSSNKVVASEQKEEDNEKIDKENDIDSNSVIVKDVDVNALYNKVHDLANTLIIAEDGEVWGREKISKESLNSVIESLKGNDDYLYNELLKWKDKDFSKAVEVHNYVWDKLGGNIGKAISINEDGVNEAIKAVSE